MGRVGSEWEIFKSRGSGQVGSRLGDEKLKRVGSGHDPREMSLTRRSGHYELFLADLRVGPVHPAREPDT